MEYQIDINHRTLPAPRTAEVASGAARVAVVCDLREEKWPSMDLVADALVEGLAGEHAEGFAAVRVCPPMRRRLSRADDEAGRRFNADRLLNRFWDYPRALGRLRREFDLFHIVDHSYAQLVHHLPAERTVVTCHDLDTFRCLLAPASEPRPRAFRWMAARILAGLQGAARVACDSRATRDALVAHKLVVPERLAVIPNGVREVFSHVPDAMADREAARLLGECEEGRVELLHVGSTIARKRIDVLLEVFAEVRRAEPRARLVRVGGALTPAQAAHAARLKVADAVVSLPFLPAEVLAAVYRRAAVVLQPSEREGFGLPVVEALACAAPVVASDLPVLREVGGEAAVSYCPVGDVDAWSGAILSVLREGDEAARARRAAALIQASQFTWGEYVRRVTELYREIIEG